MSGPQSSRQHTTAPLRLCLDFSNTLDWRSSDHPGESINGYADVVNWARGAGLVSDREARQLLREAAARPAEASAVVKQAVLIREAIYRVFSALAAGGKPKKADLDLLNEALAKAMAHSRIVQTSEGFIWGWEGGAAALDRLLWPVMRSAAELLNSSQLAQVRECAGEGCGWLLLDVSRNQLRRWCDMKSCGNRAKARRHYERVKAAQ